MADFTLEGLKGIKQGQRLPSMQMLRDWLVSDYGFRTQEDNYYVTPPVGSELLPIYLNTSLYTEVDMLTLKTIIRAVESLEKSQQSQAAHPPIDPQIQAILDGYPQYNATLSSGTLSITSKEYPEFYFTEIYRGLSALAVSLPHSLKEYSGDDYPASLPNYIRALEGAALVGLERRQVGKAEFVLASKINNEPPLPLHEDNAIRIHKINALIEHNYAIIMEQQNYIKSLQTEYGFSQEPDTDGKYLILTHSSLNERVVVPIHGSGDFKYIEQQEYEHLHDKIHDILQRRYRSDEYKESTAPKAKRIAVPDPKPNDALLVLDEDTLINLNAPRIGELGATWYDLLEKTRQLPGIGKIVIPDYIADVLMRDKVCTYDKNGEPHMQDIGKRHEPKYAAFNKFMRNAVRRHVTPEGKVEFIAEPGSEGNGGKIIIWETKKGRETSEKIAAALDNGDFINLEHGVSKAHINSMIKDELAWDNPVNIITNDLNYMLKGPHPKQTRTGKAVSLDTPLAYLEAEFGARGKELSVSLNTHTDHIEHIRRIWAHEGKAHRQIVERTSGDKESDGIIAVIHNAVEKSREARTRTEAPVKPPKQDAAATLSPAREKVGFSKVEKISFGGLLKTHFKDDHKKIADAAKKIMAARQDTRAKTIGKKLKGTIDTPARSDILYFLLEEMDKYAADKGLSQMPSEIAFRGMHCQEITASRITELLDSQDYAAAKDDLLAATVTAVNAANREQIVLGPKGVEQLQNGALPSLKVAAALRDMLYYSKVDAVEEFDRTYFAARVEESKNQSQNVRGG